MSGLRTIVPIICPERWIIAGPITHPIPPKPTHPDAGRLNPISAAAWHLYNCLWSAGQTVSKRAQTWQKKLRAGYWILFLWSNVVLNFPAFFASSSPAKQTVTVVQHTKAPNFSEHCFTVHISHVHAFACTRCIFLQQSMSNRQEVNKWLFTICLQGAWNILVILVHVWEKTQSARNILSMFFLLNHWGNRLWISDKILIDPIQSDHPQNPLQR